MDSHSAKIILVPYVSKLELPPEEKNFPKKRREEALGAKKCECALGYLTEFVFYSIRPLCDFIVENGAGVAEPFSSHYNSKSSTAGRKVWTAKTKKNRKLVVCYLRPPL